MNGRDLPPVATKIRQGEVTLGTRVHQAARGNHYHDLPGEPRAIIGATVAPPGFVALDGQTTLKKGKAPELFKLWGYTYGGSGEDFGVPDVRDRNLLGAGNVLTSGATDGYAYGTDRTDKAKSIHSHSNNLDMSTVGHSGTQNASNTGNSVRIHTIDGQAQNGSHKHNITGGVTDNGGYIKPSIGVLWVTRIQ